MTMLHTKQHQAALMVASGELSRNKIAEELDVTPTTISAWRQRPDFQALVERYRENLLGDAQAELKKTLVADGPKNVRFLIETRDGQFTAAKEVMDSRLKASQMLLDRQAPKRDEAETGGVTIVINADVMKRVEQAQVQEVEWLDGEETEAREA